MDNKKKLFFVELLLVILGLSIMVYFVYGEYFKPQSYVCDISNRLSCSYLSKTPYAYLFGIHISVFGLVWFLLYGVILFLRYIYVYSIAEIVSLIMSIFAFLFSLYLQIVEFLIVNVVCVFCVITFLVVFVLMIVNVYFYVKQSLFRNG